MGKVTRGRVRRHMARAHTIVVRTALLNLDRLARVLRRARRGRGVTRGISRAHGGKLSERTRASKLANPVVLDHVRLTNEGKKVFRR